MSLKYELDTLFSKQMDRKTFLKHVIFAVFMLTGVNAFMKLISNMNSGPVDLGMTSSSTQPKRTGYGRSGYGSKVEG